MSNFAHRSMPSNSFCQQSRWAGMPAPGSRIIHRDCRSSAGYKARIASLDEQETREYKIRKLAEILGTNVEQVSSLVKLRPGLLVVPNGDMSYYEQRVSMLAFKHGLSPPQVSAMILENPQLLFQRA
ncbi:hypothetical protein Vretimale_805 [Volvox reticuliferus]|uniref:Uncharacterized protein n=1 Tax=Volvox reticuliferus TaxID=1737510 RepID=A0A8J4C544_9CHLO|nr:hypothetical protein Vretifemale_2076 [Volvox reticuliferus]GIL94569.1 hypothetical protein Vretimale_805 [Volvox reticuliferus]